MADEEDELFVETEWHIPGSDPLGIKRIAADARRAALVEAYWKLRDHADEYEGTAGVQRIYAEARESEPGSRIRRTAGVHRSYTSGLRHGAMDLAEMLGVPECEIERPPGTSEVTGG